MALAALGGNYEVVELLLDHGANIKATNRNGNTPLHEAASHGHVAVAVALLNRLPVPERVALISMEAGWMKHTALHIAAMRGHVAFAEALLLAGAEVNKPNFAEKTPLFFALYQSGKDLNFDMVKLLLDKGAEITPAMVAKMDTIPDKNIKKMLKKRLKRRQVGCPGPVADLLEDDLWISDTEKELAVKQCKPRRKNKSNGGGALIGASCESVRVELVGEVQSAIAAASGCGASPLPDAKKFVASGAAALTAGAGALPSADYVSCAVAAAVGKASSSSDEMAEEDVALFCSASGSGAGNFRRALPSVSLNLGEEGYVNFRFSPARRFSVGGKIIFKNKSLLRADVVSLLEREEDEAAAGSDFYKRDRRAVVSLAPRVSGCSAAELRAKEVAALSEDAMDHVVSESLILNALRYGSSYLSREQAADKEPCLLIVAPIVRESVGGREEAFSREKNFLTLCFDLSKEGKIGRCFHFCAQNRHPREVSDGGEYKYALQPIDIIAKIKQESLRHKLQLKIAPAAEAFKRAWQQLALEAVE